MRHSQVIGQTLFPSDEQPPKPVKPAVGSFYHPPSGPVPGKCLLLGLLLSPSANMSRVTVADYQLSYLLEVIPFVHAQVLRPVGIELWPCGHFLGAWVPPVSCHGD